MAKSAVVACIFIAAAFEIVEELITNERPFLQPCPTNRHHSTHLGLRSIVPVISSSKYSRRNTKKNAESCSAQVPAIRYGHFNCSSCVLLRAQVL